MDNQNRTENQRSFIEALVGKWSEVWRKYFEEVVDDVTSGVYNSVVTPKHFSVVASGTMVTASIPGDGEYKWRRRLE